MSSDPSTRNVPRRRVAAVGVGLLATLCGWTVVSAYVHGSDPWPQVVLLVGVALAVAAGLLFGRREPVLSPLLVAVAVLLLSFQLVLYRYLPLPGSILGYDNADAAIMVQGIAAAGLASVGVGGQRARVCGLSVAVALFLLIVPTRSAAGLLTGGLVLGVALASPWLRHRWLAELLCLIPLLLVALTVTVGKQVAFTSVFDGQRRTLWGEAVSLIQQSPWTGVGPGRFAVESMTARSDADLRWAHSFPLQLTAELGIPGALILSGLLAWIALALVLLAPSPAVAVVGAASAAAFAIQSCVDHLADFPAVTLTSALLFGVATASTGGIAATGSRAGNPGLTPP